MIMTCPKCSGSGKGWIDYGGNSTIAIQESICNSCGGLGYLTEGEEKPKKKTPTQILKEIKELLNTEYLKNHQISLDSDFGIEPMVAAEHICEFIRYLQDQIEKTGGG